MLLNYGVGEDSWETLGLQGDSTSPFWKRSTLGFLWKEWRQSWNSSTLATSCEESSPMSQLFTWGGQSTGVSALASVLPKKSQGWSPSEWTGWISLQSKGLSRAFSNTTVQSHRFFGAQPSSQSNSQHSENEDHGIKSHHSMGSRWGNSGNSVRLYFWGLQNHCRW